MRLKPLLFSTERYVLVLFLIESISAIRVYTGTKLENEYKKNVASRRNDRAGASSEWMPVNIDLVKEKPTLAATDSVKWRRSDDVDEESTQELKASPLIYKIRLTQKGYIQFLKYLVDVPPLQDFTFCLWLNSHNLTHNHPILSYSRDEKERYIRSWIDPKQHTLTLLIREERVFKIPFVMKENKWYHICESFSGYTGQWIVFIDGKNRGTGIVKQMQGVFVPGGGDLVVGQEYTDFDKGLDDGIEGEIFGFNMADEAVNLEDDNNLNYAHRTPFDMISSKIPPFKKLPQAGKSFQEIKRFIETLPPVEDATTTGGLGEATEPTRTEKPRALSYGRFRADKHRHRKPPPRRKVVVYYDDLKRMGLAAEEPQHRNDVESPLHIPHQFKVPKIQAKISTYQIHEDYEDETEKSPKVYEETREEPKDKISNKSRKARYDNNLGQFSLNLTREANRKYPLTMQTLSKTRPKYHFETLNIYEINKIVPTTEKYEKIKKIENSRTPIQFGSDSHFLGSSQRRSFNVANKQKNVGERKMIPVYEIVEEDVPKLRRSKRQVEQEGDMLGTFKKMPLFPLDFFKTVIEDKNETGIEQYFPKNKSEEVTVAPETHLKETVGQMSKQPIYVPQMPVSEIPQNPTQLIEEINHAQSMSPELMQPISMHPVQQLQSIQTIPVQTMQANVIQTEAPQSGTFLTNPVFIAHFQPIPMNIPEPTTNQPETPVNNRIYFGNVRQLPNIIDTIPKQHVNERTQFGSFRQLPLDSIKQQANVVETTTKNSEDFVNDRVYFGNVRQSLSNEELDRLDIGNDIMSSGTELVIKSYGYCTSERGSPVSNKKHLIVAWSSTPVRIYGGALVSNAKNICGYF